jgi:glycosyltransferase involved in cell wall biosynthesis
MMQKPYQFTFVILSFEGPDLYSMAGGLATRIIGLTETLARLGFETHLIFIGDPQKPSVEIQMNGKLHLHRWGQWISQYYPNGVYDGEEGKLQDYQDSVPNFVLTEIAQPALSAGKRLVVMAEEWQTSETLCRISDVLWKAGLRDRAQLLWNANNTIGFHRINWGRLNFIATLTTVSRYMKHTMWTMGLNPLVIPNGIPSRLLRPVNPTQVVRIRRVLEAETMLVKIARFDPDKRWLMTMEVIARLKAEGDRVVLLARGGIESHGKEVMSYARRLGLIVRDVYSDGEALLNYWQGLRLAGRADVYNLRYHVPEHFRQVIYAGADLILANSGREPFGLVGLEAMAAGGVVVTGSTGEDYALPFENALVLDTDNPVEIVTYLHHLREEPDFEKKIRLSAQETAQRFTWEEVVGCLKSKLDFLSGLQLDDTENGAKYRDLPYPPPAKPLAPAVFSYPGLREFDRTGASIVR